jgi:hypothetical protein
MARTFRAVTFLACLACARFAYPQSGDIAGVITDDQGAPVAGVFVTAHGFDQSKRIQTDADGRYLLHDLLSGRYVVTVARDGYTTAVRNGFMVRVGKTATLLAVIKADAGDAQLQKTAVVRTPRFRGLPATSDGTLPAYNPIESLPPMSALLMIPTKVQIRR